MDPRATSSCRRGAGARASRGSRRRACLQAHRAVPGASRAARRSRKNVCEVRLRHPCARRCPETVASDETSSTRSRERFSAARRSSRVSASGAKRTASGPSCVVVTGAVEHDHTTNAPRRDEARERVDQLAPVVERPRVQEVVAVEEVERRVGHHEAARRWRRASYRSTAAATLTFSDSTAPVERDRDERVAGSANERAEPLALGAEHERDAARQVGVPHRRLGITGGAVDPERRALHLFEVAGEVRHDGDRQVLDRARRRPRHGRRHDGCAVRRNDRPRSHRRPRRSGRPRRGCADR